VVYHWILLAAGLLTAFTYCLLAFKSPWQLLFVACTPLFVLNGLAVRRYDGRQLDPYLRQMALSTLLFVVLFGLGQLVAA
jgi:1,4-dihydroxy-2-naphthoate octaprenyltransferase